MRIAIVGAGVSGLVAARALYQRHEITLFEAQKRLGGHVHTWDVSLHGEHYTIDSGFIVYNERNYPNFTRLLAELGVASQPSTMSFSVRDDRSGVEYNGSTTRQLLAQPRNLLRPPFLRMLADVVRFNRAAARTVREGLTETLGALLARQRYSQAFVDWYLLPMGSAIWSIPVAQVLDMPAAFFVRFFENHGMLTVNDRPQWRVVCGGSARYVEALIAPFRDRIRSGRPVRHVARFSDRIEVDGESFDHVIMACHSDEALSLLADAARTESDVLGALPYQLNEAVLHTDVSVLPRSRSAWAAWNYRVGADTSAPAAVTYNMNMLQSLQAPDTFCVTLNDTGVIDASRVLGRVQYHHPVFTRAGAAAQQRRGEISGVNRTHFCGAYWGNGFHEDGVVSGLAVVREIAEAVARVRERVPA